MGTFMASVSFRRAGKAKWSELKPIILEKYQGIDGLVGNLEQEREAYAIVSPYGDMGMFLQEMPETVSRLTGDYAVFCICVDSGDERCARDYPRAELLREVTQVVEYALVRHTGPTLVLVGIHVLDVIEKDVGVFCGALENVTAYKSAGLDCGADAFFFAAPKEFDSELGLCKTFTSGDGNAAVIAVEYCVRTHLCHDLIHGHRASRDASRFLPAGGNTCAAAGAECAVLMRAAVSETYRTCGTCGNTCTAAGAATCSEHKLRRCDIAFGICAPCAAEWAALDENIGADTRSVMHAVVLNIKYCACHMPSWLIRSITSS